MAGKLEPLKEEWQEEAEEVAEGQAMSLRKTEDLLEMVKKLQKEGSLEPQIKDLIHRINELQQAKKKSSEELGEAQALQEALHRDLDSLNEETVHVEEVLSKKQETLTTLQQHYQERESESQWLNLGEQLEELTNKHKDLWEFHMLEQRLAQEIRALEFSREQLLGERTLVLARLQEVELRLRSAEDVQGTQAQNRGLKTEQEKFQGQIQSAPDAWVGKREPESGAPGAAGRAARTSP